MHKFSYHAFLSVFLLFTVLIGNSCKKQDTFRNQLLGLWYDGAGNHVQFNGDGTGEIQVLGYNKETISWSLQDNNTQLLIVYAPNNSEVWTIVSLSSTMFQFYQGSSTQMVRFTR